MKPGDRRNVFQFIWRTPKTRGQTERFPILAIPIGLTYIPIGLTEWSPVDAGTDARPSPKPNE